jgi:putative transposase
MLGVYRQVLTQEGPPMVLSQSVASNLLEAFRAGEGVDPIRESVRLVLQE